MPASVLGFSVILHLNIFMARYLSMVSSVNAGANEVKRANFGSKLEQWKAMHEHGWSVATFQRRDVPTSRRPHVVTSPTSRRWVNHYKSQQAVTSRRCNVATLAQDLPSIIKSIRGSELEASGGVRTRAQKSRAAATPISKKSP